MILFYLLCALLLFANGPAVAAEPKIDTCVSCHTELDDELLKPVHLLEQDIHSRQGLSCVDCHGGDAADEDEDGAMDEDAGFIGIPDKDELPRFCGKCHSDAEYIRQYNPALRVDQVTLYKTSVHGQRLLGRGDHKVAGCVDCHHAHGILPASDPRSPVNAANVPRMCGTCHSDPTYMKEYGIPTDQFERYRMSVHGRPLLEEGDLSAPACNDCHGNHGATPPGVKSLANVCGQCHPINNELVSKSPHRPAFEKLGIAACETCHNHHDIAPPSDEMVGTEPPAVCIRCHRPDKWPKGWEGAGQIRATLDSLVGQYKEAETIVRRAERKGMEVGEALFVLNEASGHITKTRSALHLFDPDTVRAVSQEGMKLTSQAAQQGEAALEELDFRRKGLGISLLVIVILAGALYVKIRTLEK